MNLLWVMLGGFFGAIARYTLGEWMPAANGFPVGTMSVNLIGCLFLGWFTAFISYRKNTSSVIPLLVGTGFTGSFTTFSTFSVETFQLLEQQFYFMAFLYVLGSLTIGILLAFAGYRLGFQSERGEHH
ncbi:fluoride efflux transporter CrcB [Pseudalkalibacillus sp. SCS-8]|uniref:fluoride efflux transporter CrcB n=1 Tax=Pseudalkalibacillus nanhaiensis TaxID=3115291 RepID=UPI0032D9BCF7